MKYLDIVQIILSFVKPIFCIRKLSIQYLGIFTVFGYGINTIERTESHKEGTAQNCTKSKGKYYVYQWIVNMGI